MIGTCGFRITKEEYIKNLSSVEIQHTFYQPPKISTLEGWRAQVPKDFEFTLKAWQLITHDPKSPTYKRLRRKLTKTELNEAGSFKASAIVKEAWKITLASAKALKATVVLFQCPASFEATKENIANLDQFFSTIDRGNLKFCWEPRGAWEYELIRRICNTHDLWHTVDPFVCRTVTPDKCYFRLHGRIRWRYQYETEELEELAALLPANKQSYVFFNNITMTRDAQLFQNIVRNMLTK